MKNRVVISFLLCLLVIIVACRHKDRYAVVPFSLPHVPLVYQLPDHYLPVNSTDTLIRLDSLGQHYAIEVFMLNTHSARLWQIDTMHFVFKNRLSNWDFQKRGFYWTFQGPNYSSDHIRNRDGIETEVHDHCYESFMFHPVRQPARGTTYPTIDYSVMDEYWYDLRADVVGIASPTDAELFVLAHPIVKRVRQKDLYQMKSATDSVPLPYYRDQVDSTRMICLRISLNPLNQFGKTSKIK